MSMNPAPFHCFCCLCFADQLNDIIVENYWLPLLHNSCAELELEYFFLNCSLFAKNLSYNAPGKSCNEKMRVFGWIIETDLLFTGLIK